MKTTLTKRHQETYDAIFHHPIAHNLHRGDVTSMLGALAEVSEESNGNLKATRNGQTLVLHASRDKNVAAMDELTTIRRFLERSEALATESLDEARHFLVVIDHREARVYKAEVHGAVPHRIAPFDPHGYGRNLHYVQDESDGKRKPERKSFYEAIAKTLHGAKDILMFGSGTGASSAMEQLLAMLQQSHPEIARCVAGTITLDTQHLTEDQVLAKARDFYEKRTPASSTT